ncbi:MAG: ABC transporter permease, partial [Ruminococcus sp.]|nr:ABC transporter permease [Ruminococcus sp.]
MKKLGSKIYFAVIMAFLYLPIVYLIAYSFNNGKTSVWKGFTLKWYEALFNDAQIMGSLYNTLIIAILASIISTVLGTLAAIGIYNFKGGVRSALQNVSNIPIINPEIVTGVSL